MPLLTKKYDRTEIMLKKLANEEDRKKKRI